MKAVDFFCGAGGLTKGLQLAGIDVIAGIDTDAICGETYSVNNAPTRFINSDIRDITADEVREMVPEIVTNRDDVLFAGCAPCQPFSKQRRTESNGEEATILSEFGRLVRHNLPGQVLVENVSGMARVQGYSTFRRFLKVLVENGYRYEYSVLDAKCYGVPQTRRRLVLIAIRGIDVNFPPPTHGKGLQRFLYVRDAIERFPEIGAGESHPTIPNHTAAHITPLNLERLENTPLDGGDRRSWPDRLVLDCHKNSYVGHTDVYGRMYWDKPAPTLTSRCYSISNGRYGHPVQNRAISLREASALQTFPDNYVFYGHNTHIGLQIGNAVPVTLGEILGRHIVSLRNNTW